MNRNDGAGPKARQLRQSTRTNKTDNVIVGNYGVARETMDIIIGQIMNERCEEALLFCKTLGMCKEGGEADSPASQCLPIRLLEASLTTHRHNAYEAYIKLKGYLEECCPSYQDTKCHSD